MSFHDFAWRAKELRRGRTASKATGRPLLPNTRSRQMTQAITCAFPRLRVSIVRAWHGEHSTQRARQRNLDRQVQTARGERASGKRTNAQTTAVRDKKPSSTSNTNAGGSHPNRRDPPVYFARAYSSSIPLSRSFGYLRTLLPHALEPKLEVEANGTLTPADVDASRPHQEQDQEHPDRSPEQHSHQCAQGPSSEEPSYSHSAREQSLTQKEKAQSWEE